MQLTIYNTNLAVVDKPSCRVDILASFSEATDVAPPNADNVEALEISLGTDVGPSPKQREAISIVKTKIRTQGVS